jgi:hypothetical protein
VDSPRWADDGWDGVSRIAVSQFMHRNVSNVVRLSCDLLASMATPQSGQSRIGDKERCIIITPSAHSADPVLMQIKSSPPERRPGGAVKN